MTETLLNNVPEDSDDEFTFAIPPDMAPEDVLEVVIGLCHEIRHPLNKIERLLMVLQDQGYPDLHPRAVREIHQWVEGVRYILKIVYDYDENREF